MCENKYILYKECLKHSENCEKNKTGIMEMFFIVIRFS